MRMDLWQCICPGVLAYMLLNLLTLSTDAMNSTESLFKQTERGYTSNQGHPKSTNNETAEEYALSSTQINTGTFTYTEKTLPPSTGFSSTHPMSSISPATLFSKQTKSNDTIIEAESRPEGSISFLNTESPVSLHGNATHSLPILQKSLLLSQGVTHNITELSKLKDNGTETHSLASHYNVTTEGPNFDCKQNCTKPHHARKGRHRKHMHSHRARGRKHRFYNYKMLYNSIKHEGEDRKKETEFYAWIFGATMLTLGSLTTMTSCFIFCYCSDRWRQRRKYRYNKDCSYQRVDSVSSVVDSLDHVTII